MSDQLPDIQKILTLLRDAGWREAHLRFGDFELSVSDSALPNGSLPTSPAAPTPPVAPPATPTPSAGAAVAETADGVTDQTVGERAAPAEPDAGYVVEAASIGVFWRSPQPGAPPFVEVGDTVAPDTTVCILEVMKLMTHVKAGTHGVVRAIHVDNGGMVEYGDALISIDPR